MSSTYPWTVSQAPGHANEDVDWEFSHGGWTGPQMADHRRVFSESFPASGGFLLGRRTFEIFSGYWPTVQDPSDAIARALNELPKYVASSRLEEPAWARTTVIRDVRQEVGALRSQTGLPLRVLGSHQLARSLADLHLVDEYEVWIHPVVLGQGKRLFPIKGPRIDLSLIASRCSPSGLVVINYAVQHGSEPSHSE